MSRAVEVSSLPQGVERVLTLAALDRRFRGEIARDPVAAAASKGIVLSSAETDLLRAAKPDELVAMAERMILPRSAIDRRGFMRSVSASIVAMVTGKAIMLCSGCTGIDAWSPDGGPDADGGAEQKWTMLGGFSAYLYLPRVVAADRTEPHPVMLALNGEDETCLASVQRWRTAAETYGFGIIAVNWTGADASAEQKSQLAGGLKGMIDEYSQTWSTLGQPCTIASRGASTDIAFQAAYLGMAASSWSHAIFLGGAPLGDWVGNGAALAAGVQPGAPALLYVIGADADQPQATACAGALAPAGVSVNRRQLPVSLSAAVLDFSELYLAAVS